MPKEESKPKKENVTKTKADDSTQAAKKKEQTIRTYIGKYLKEYKPHKEEIVEAYVTSSSRQELNNKLQKSFSNDEVSDILSILKNLIKDMPGRTQ